MPRVLNFPKAIQARIEQRERRIEDIRSEIATLEKAKQVFQETSSTPRRRRGRRKTQTS